MALQGGVHVKPVQTPSRSPILPARHGQASTWCWALALLTIIALLALGCGPQPMSVPPGQPVPTAMRNATLTVFAAASLTESFGEIGPLFEAEHPGVRVILNLAGSQQLAQQLAQGAPADVFASANETQMQVAVDAGRVAAGSQRVFVRNRLVVVFPQDNPAGIQSLPDLARPGLRLVLAAADVPVGKYSLEFLDKASQDLAFGPTFKEGVLANVVSYEQTVKAVLTKVVLGEGDAGIVYLSDISLDNADKVGRLEIPDPLNSLATYPIALVSDSAEPDLAQAFIDLVLSPQGQEILTKFGFVSAP
jgi:molybdate transport system substrate-binding protein